MKNRVTGLGGFFFKTEDPDGIKDWYKNHLGLNTDAYGCTFWWKDEKGIFYNCFISVDEDVDYGISTKNFVRSYGKGITKLEPIGEIGEDGIRHQCRVTVTRKLDARGFLPAFIVIKTPKSHTRRL